MEEEKLNNPVKLTSVATKLEAEMIGTLLEENGISCYIKDLEAGGYMNIYMGFSVYGSELYVRESDLETAKALLNEQVRRIEPGEEPLEAGGEAPAERVETDWKEGWDLEEDEEDEIDNEDIFLSKISAVGKIVGIAVGVLVISIILFVVL